LISTNNHQRSCCVFYICTCAKRVHTRDHEDDCWCDFFRSRNVLFGRYYKHFYRKYERTEGLPICNICFNTFYTYIVKKYSSYFHQLGLRFFYVNSTWTGHLGTDYYVSWWVCCILLNDLVDRIQEDKIFPQCTFLLFASYRIAYQIFVIYCILAHKTSLTPPFFIEVPVPNHER